MDAEKLHVTYEMASTPPPVISWQEYEERAAADWRALLCSGDGCDERRVRDFLVKHPSFVPGASGLLKPSGYEPCHWAILASCPLREWVHAEDRRRDVTGLEVPDFIWLAHNSKDLTPVLVRIGSPCGKWFTERGEPEDAVVLAIDRLREWREWLSQPKAVVAFHSTFETPVSIRRHGNFQPEFVLIHGRNKEFGGRPELVRLRSELQEHNLVFLTFDDLQASRDRAGYICISRREETSCALSVPATMRLGPRIAGEWCRIQGFSDAIMANEWITPERQRFLTERLPYWQRWARSPKRLPYRLNLDDWE